MKLATLRIDDITIAARIHGHVAIEIAGVPDVGALLAHSDWHALAEGADGRMIELAELDEAAWAPVIPAPGKIVCVGLNYRKHILEMGRELPEHPTLFAKYPEALVGAFDPIVVPAYAAEALDWEGELAVIIGKSARRLDVTSAADAIAGYSVINDVTMRDYQYRTPEWFQGKTFDDSSPFGPVLVTAEDYAIDGLLQTFVNDEKVQETTTDGLVFGPAELVSYISHIVTLAPGDVIATGTPGGVGHARDPKKYLHDGDILRTSIGGIGELINRVVVED
jgi:acylpyruvate hydrolase